MKIHVLVASLGLALALPLPAFAAESHPERRAGHYEWRAVPQFGPRATAPLQKRVWVPDNKQMANCDCDMMKMGSSECMMPMHRMGPHHRRSAG